MQLCDIITPCCFLLIHCLLRTFIAHFITHVVSHLAAHILSLYHIKFFTEFSSYFILLILISSYRLLKKGSTSPHTIIHFAGSSHCKFIILEPTMRGEFSEFLCSCLTHHSPDALNMQLHIVPFRTKSMLQ